MTADLPPDVRDRDEVCVCGHLKGDHGEFDPCLRCLFCDQYIRNQFASYDLTDDDIRGLMY